jgi:CRP-like cAMP-binding protein
VQLSASDITNQIGGMIATHVAAVTSSPIQIVAHLAAAVAVVLLIVAAFVRTMIPLRWLVVGSNVGLLVYGALHPSLTTMAVAAALMPINVYRAIEMMRLTRRVMRTAEASELATVWLKPYMKKRRLAAGRVLFHKGDTAHRMYLLADGEMEVAEIGVRLEPGRIFGEIALFSPDHTRTFTVRCLTRCTVLEIEESTVRQLYFQNPAFGFHLIGLLTSRLRNDLDRAEQERQSDQRSSPSSGSASARQV